MAAGDPNASAASLIVLYLSSIKLRILVVASSCTPIIDILAYIYDRRAVQFTGMAAETDGKRKKNRETGVCESVFSWWRKPYMASFKAGTFDFVALTAHLQWGTRGGRKKEPG
jgi:hypothetical protein